MRHIALTTAVVAGILASSLWYTPIAQATPRDPTCPALKYDFVGYDWSASDNTVLGIRAPVKNRLDGLLCVPASQGAFGATWIAIEDNNSNNVVQIGWDHDFNALGLGQWCRFWVNGLGIPHDYNCSRDLDGTFVWFKIEVYANGGPLFYSIKDCGTGGDFDNCTQENGSQAYFSSAYAGAISEVDFRCTEVISVKFI